MLLTTTSADSILLSIGEKEFANRERFLLNYRTEFELFERLIGLTYQTWARVGAEKDRKGKSHAGLSGFVMIYIRHTSVSIQRLMASQSFSAWPTFRPGLEALLFAGKWIDDPANAKVWRDRRKSREASKEYTKVFGGDNVVSKSLPRSKAFHRVLCNINDDLMHPNAEFFERDFNVEVVNSQTVARVDFSDRDRNEYEGHILAFLNLLDLIRASSEELVNMLYGPTAAGVQQCVQVAKGYDVRAADLARRNEVAKAVMVDLGLWKF